MLPPSGVAGRPTHGDGPGTPTAGARPLLTVVSRRPSPSSFVGGGPASQRACRPRNWRSLTRRPGLRRSPGPGRRSRSVRSGWCRSLALALMASRLYAHGAVVPLRSTTGLLRKSGPARWPPSRQTQPSDGLDDAGRMTETTNVLVSGVGLPGLEPGTSSLSGKRSNRLSYRPGDTGPPPVGRSETLPHRLRRPKTAWTRNVRDESAVVGTAIRTLSSVSTRRPRRGADRLREGRKRQWWSSSARVTSRPPSRLAARL